MTAANVMKMIINVIDWTLKNRRGDRKSSTLLLYVFSIAKCFTYLLIFFLKISLKCFVSIIFIMGISSTKGLKHKFWYGAWCKKLDCVTRKTNNEKLHVEEQNLERF